MAGPPRKKVSADLAAESSLVRTLGADSLRDGTWFRVLLGKVLKSFVVEATREELLRRYPGVNEEDVVNHLIGETANATALAAVVAAAGTDVALIAGLPSGGATIPAGAADDIRFVTAGDVNADLKPDLVGLDRSLNVASVLMNTTPNGAANASFMPKVDFPVGINPDAAVVADFSGDGKLDIAVTNSTSLGSVSVLVNNTSAGAPVPSFATRVDVPLAARLFGLAAGDVNGDGKLDLATIDNAAGNVVVLLNTRP